MSEKRTYQFIHNDKIQSVEAYNRIEAETMIEEIINPQSKKKTKGEDVDTTESNTNDGN